MPSGCAMRLEAVGEMWTAVRKAEMMEQATCAAASIMRVHGFQRGQDGGRAHRPSPVAGAFRVEIIDRLSPNQSLRTSLRHDRVELVFEVPPLTPRARALGRRHRSGFVAFASGGDHRNCARGEQRHEHHDFVCEDWSAVPGALLGRHVDDIWDEQDPAGLISMISHMELWSVAPPTGVHPVGRGQTTSRRARRGCLCRVVDDGSHVCGVCHFSGQLVRQLVNAMTSSAGPK